MQRNLFEELAVAAVVKPFKVLRPADVHHGADVRSDFFFGDEWMDAKSMDAPSQFPRGSALADETSWAVFDNGFVGVREYAGSCFVVVR